VSHQSDLQIRDDDGIACEVRSHLPTSAGDQYSPETPVDNPNGVVPNTTVKKIPNTGGPLTLRPVPFCSGAWLWWCAVY
jgi:hypothetical protein